MKNGTVKNLGELKLRELVDLGLRMPDGSTELFEVVNITDDCVTVMTKNIIDFMPFNARENKHSGNANSYEESSIRSYLIELYQSVAKENAELDKYNYSFKAFFLPSVNMLGIGTGKGWQAFKDDASRIKYSGEYAVAKDEAYGLGEAEWYWLNTPHASYSLGVYAIHASGSLNFDSIYSNNRGVAPALNLEPSAPLVLNDGVWCLTKEKTNTEDSNTSIDIGDWVEVTHTAEIDIQEGILLGDCFEVVGFGAQGEVNITLSSGKSWYLSTAQVRKIKSPLLYHKKTRESVEHDERLKGYYQHTAIETLKIYHLKVFHTKEERIKDLNKALENIQELINLEKKND